MNEEEIWRAAVELNQWIDEFPEGNPREEFFRRYPMAGPSDCDRVGNAAIEYAVFMKGVEAGEAWLQ